MGKARDLANLLTNGLVGPAKLSAGAPTWNAAGSVGIKATPNANWASDYAVLQMNSTGSINGNAVAIVMANNTYYDGANTRYLTTGPASDYFQYNGTHTWRYAASGTAGAVATMVPGMTQDASGKLSVAGVIESTAGGVKFPDATVQMTAQNGIGFKNRIINGEMRIDQRNNGASVTVSGTGGYTLDRWSPQRAGALSNFTCVRSTTAPIGYTNSMLFTMGTGVTPTSTDYAYFSQNIEGFNTADLGFGTTNAATVTLSFWVRSSVTGTFGAGLRNLSGGRCYIAPYTINSANTWEQKTVTIAGDTSGTWPTDNSIGIRVDFDLGVGPNNSTTGGTWQSVNGFGLTGGTKLAATSGATFYITGVQLEAGTVATPFERRDYGRELMMCQRYYESVYLSVNTYAAQWTGVEFFGVGVPFKTTKRVAPTIPNPTASGYWVTAAQNAYSAAGVHTFQAAYSSEFGFSLKSNRPAGNATPTVANMYLWEGALTISASSEL